MTQVNYTKQKVLKRKEWIPGKLFSITTTRDPNFNFKPGQFARLGLCSESSETPDIWRAFSMVNSPDDNHLEFYAVTVPDGEFSPRLAKMQEGDEIYLNKTAFGFLTIDQFPQGGTLWLLATGTGLSAYISMLHDPITWERFDSVILCHGTRYASEFSYQEVIQTLQNKWQERFVYLPISSREKHLNYPQARLTTLIQNGELEKLAQHSLDAEIARIMLCGNPQMLKDVRAMLKEHGFAAGRRGNIGNLAAEKYW